MKKIKWMLLLTIVGAVPGCGPLIHRETLVYGFVTDEDGMPVDSICMVLTGGRTIVKSDIIGEACSDKVGFYEVEVDVGHKYLNVDIGLDINSDGFSRKYKTYESTKNGGKMRLGGGNVKIGSRTRYDFKLIR